MLLDIIGILAMSASIISLIVGIVNSKREHRKNQKSR